MSDPTNAATPADTDFAKVAAEHLRDLKTYIATQVARIAAVESDILTKTLPVGTVGYFAANTLPAGWLKCDGSAVSRATYAALFAYVGVIYGVGDGVTTFNLPDIRGEFIRGFDDARGIDAGRVIGSAQAQAVQSHTHPVSTGFPAGGAQTQNVIQRGPATNSNINSNNLTDAAGGAETRPRNVAMLACIKT